MISKPKEYIDILLHDLVKTIQIATKNFFDETYHNRCALVDAHDRLTKSMDKVDLIKEEIFYIISHIQGDSTDE